MTVAPQPRNRYLDRPSPSSLADVIDTILDKGLVIDIYVRVSLVGIEILTIDARIVVASVDTYLRYAEAMNRTKKGGATLNPFHHPPTARKRRRATNLDRRRSKADSVITISEGSIDTCPSNPGRQFLWVRGFDRASDPSPAVSIRVSVPNPISDEPQQWMGPTKPKIIRCVETIRRLANHSGDRRRDRDTLLPNALRFAARALTSVTSTRREKRHDSTAAATTDTGGRPATRQRMRHAPRRAPSARHHHCDCDHFGRIRPSGLDFQLTMAAHMPAHCALRWRRSGITGNIWIDLQMSMADI
jgi:hypothetical protein